MVVSRFELMTVLFEQFQITDSVIARPGFENVTKCQRRKCRVTACAAAADNQSIDVRIAAISQVPGSVNAIIDIHNPPLPVQPLAVSATITGAPTVIHVQDPKPATRPIRNAEF